MIMQIIFAFTLLAADPEYVRIPNEFKTVTKSQKVINNMTPIKEQDGIGLCYAFGSATLLEHYTCTQKALDCNRTNPDNRLSPLHLATFDHIKVSGGISIGGFSDHILRKVNNVHGPIVQEKCAPYESLIQKGKVMRDGALVEATTEEVGYEKIKSLYNKSRKQGTDCVHCARELKEIFGDKIQSSVADILEAMKDPQFETFLTKILLPKHCIDNGTFIPPYQIDAFPNGNQKAIVRPEQLKDHVIKYLYNDLPVGVSFCPRRSNKAPCSSGAHFAVINGMKKVCSKDKCKIAFKLQNSYGKDWQDANSDGWVDADWLMQVAYEHSRDKMDQEQLSDILVSIRDPNKFIAEPPASFMKSNIVESNTNSNQERAIDQRVPPKNCAKIGASLWRCVDENGHQTLQNEKP